MGDIYDFQWWTISDGITPRPYLIWVNTKVNIQKLLLDKILRVVIHQLTILSSGFSWFLFLLSAFCSLFLYCLVHKFSDACNYQEIRKNQTTTIMEFPTKTSTNNFCPKFSEKLQKWSKNVFTSNIQLVIKLPIFIWF